MSSGAIGPRHRMPAQPSILTTTVGSYPAPDWLAARPNEQTRLDATRVVFDTQRQAGIDLPTDGEIYRFDANHADTNGMIDYFIRPMSGIRSQVGRSDHEAFAQRQAMR
jgi:5-methyltetrahydropteroyltriglutamate--homocysteine methyltransferase